LRRRIVDLVEQIEEKWKPPAVTDAPA